MTLFITNVIAGTSLPPFKSAFSPTTNQLLPHKPWVAQAGQELSAGDTTTSKKPNPPKTSFSTCAAEFGGALGGTVCCGGTSMGCLYTSLFMTLLVIGIEATGGSANESAYRIITDSAVGGVAALALMPLSAAFGVTEVGKRMDPGGRFLSSWLGAVCGAVAGFGLGYGAGYIVDKTADNQNLYWAILPTTLLGNAAGAVIGYNLSRPGESRQGFFNNRFDLPKYGFMKKMNTGMVQR